VTLIDAEVVQDEGESPEIRLRIKQSAAWESDVAGDRPLTFALSIKETIAARDALNRALNDLGLPEQD
jgi:hypothetical protein